MDKGALEEQALLGNFEKSVLWEFIKKLLLDSKYDSYCCLTQNIIVTSCLWELVGEGICERIAS
jgi:hypothetical protein